MSYKKITHNPEITEEGSIIQDLLLEIMPLLEAESNEDTVVQARLIWQKIEEDLDCINNSLNDVIQAENKFRDFINIFPAGKPEDYWDIIKDFKPMAKKYDALHYIQLNYVDCVISFYEKLYTYLSHLSLFINTIAPKKYKDQIGGQGKDKHSNSTFVESLGKLFKKNLRFFNICNQLSNLVNFRSQMVHSINSKDFVWVTMDYEKNKDKEVGTYLLFIKTKVKHVGENLSPTVKQKIPHGYQHTDPYKSNYMPPFETDEWYVAPNCNDSLETLIEFSRQLFKLIAS